MFGSFGTLYGRAKENDAAAQLVDAVSCGAADKGSSANVCLADSRARGRGRVIVGYAGYAGRWVEGGSSVAKIDHDGELQRAGGDCKGTGSESDGDKRILHMPWRPMNERTTGCLLPFPLSKRARVCGTFRGTRSLKPTVSCSACRNEFKRVAAG